MGTGEWIALVASLVALATVLAKTVQGMVEKKRENGNGKDKKLVHTLDLKVQATALNEIRNDLDEARRATYDVKGMVKRILETTQKIEEVPHQLQVIDGKLEMMAKAQEESRKEFARAMNENTKSNRELAGAVRTLVEFLSKNMGSTG